MFKLNILIFNYNVFKKIKKAPAAFAEGKTY